jgi:N-acyl-D-aspartate/D-glutamate deacylase
MTSNPDLVIRGGSIADGLGGDLFEGDVAIKDGRITEVGRVAGKGTEEIDAKGKLVAPGFVDLHTHYDGQVTWSQDITPSSQNGVTSAVMGNCGVGFAPCRPSDHVRLIQLMEGVEDIPEPVLSAGIPWAWESFPDYMDWLSRRGSTYWATAARAAIPRRRRTMPRWRRLRAMPCGRARWGFRPREPSTTAPPPATTRPP